MLYVMKHLYKAKKYVVGTVREWKDGRYIKDNEHHWQLLEKLVHDMARKFEVSPKAHEVKTLHRMARGIMEHAKDHPNPTVETANETLNQFDEGKFSNFDKMKEVAHGLVGQWVMEHKKLPREEAKPEPKKESKMVVRQKKKKEKEPEVVSLQEEISRLEPQDEKIASVDYWYDRHTRSWVVQKMNSSGEVLGDSLYSHSLEEAQSDVEDIVKENPGIKVLNPNYSSRSKKVKDQQKTAPEPKDEPKPDPEPTQQAMTPPQAKPKGFQPSQYQQAIFDFITHGKGNAIVDAVAGSGKSTTLEQAYHLLDPEQQRGTKFIAYNKHIKAELEKRNLPVQTLHSAGLSAWYNAIGIKYSQGKVDDKKIREIVRSNFEEGFETRSAVEKLVSKAKIEGLVPNDVMLNNPKYSKLMDDTEDNWKYLMSRYQIETPETDEVSDEDIIDLCRKTLSLSIQSAFRGHVDYDDMVYMPFITNAGLPKYKMMFVDELQDLSPLAHGIVKKMLAYDGRFVGVGDPWQSMYAFAGADVKGMPKAKVTFNAKELPLSICYRCPKSIIALAQTLVPHIQAAPWADQGQINEYGAKYKVDMFKPDDMILCRNNAPLIKMAYKLISNKIPCTIVGRSDFGKPLADIIEKVSTSGRGKNRKAKALSLNDLSDRLKEWHQDEVQKLLRRDKDADTSVADDKYETLMVFVDDSGAKDSIGVKGEIEKLFTEGETKGKVKLSSVHRAKGLEADDVYILNRELFNPKWAKTADQIQQEKNVEYVAYTRAKKTLSFINIDIPKKDKEKKVDMEKAKRLPVGTIREWKDGKYIKESEHHWGLLEDLVHSTAKEAGVKKKDPEAKLLNEMTRSAVVHIKKHPEPNEEDLHRHLDKFDADEYENFNGLKHAVSNILSKYVNEHKKLKTGAGPAETPTGKRQQSWADQVAEKKKELNQEQMDIWVSAQFIKNKKPIMHLLKVAREVVGDRKDINTSQGFTGLCKLIIDRAYERGPDAFMPETLDNFTKAFETYLTKVTETRAEGRSTDDKDKIEGLLDRNPFYREHEEWFRYCVHRMLEKNGAVSYSGLKRYMENAMKKYKGVVPDYEGKKKAPTKYVVRKPKKKEA